MPLGWVLKYGDNDSCVAKDNDWDAGDGDLQMGLQAALGGEVA